MTKKNHHLALCKTLIAITACLAFASDPANAQDSQTIVHRVIAAERYMDDHLNGYTVTENYKLFSPGDNTPVANATYAVQYVRGQGKTYTETGTPEFRKAFAKLAIGMMIEGQQKASRPPVREHVLITPENYTMTLVGTPTVPGPVPKYICQLPRPPLRNTFILRLTPREPRPELIYGLMWVDATTLRTIRIEGQLSAAPSIFTGRPFIERDYKDLNGFAMAYSSCQVTEGFLAHQLSQITYDGYILHSGKNN